MKSSEWSEIKVAVVGLGKSGQASVEVLSTLGAELIAIDENPKMVESLAANYPTVQCACLKAEDLADKLQEFSPGIVVLSPGIPPSHPLYKWTDRQQVPRWSEVELAWQIQTSMGTKRDSDGRNPGPAWLTVTGTNGKTSTVKMLGSMLRASGLRAKEVGNIGEPVVLAAASGKYQVLAVELSSFQLHNTHSVSPYAALCLNIDQDHLDWHGSARAYQEAKGRVYHQAQSNVVYNAQDEKTLELALSAEVVEGCRAIGFSLQIPNLYQIGIVENLIVDRAFGVNPYKEATALATFESLTHFAGAHPPAPILQDVMGAACLARSYGVDPEAIRNGLANFKSEPHRRAIVGTYAGVTWINDSKATNTHAAEASIKGLPDKSVVWIAGGDTKGQDFSSLIQEIKSTLRGVVLIGVKRDALREALKTYAPEVPVVELAPHPELMTSAIHEANALCPIGGQVILAPACASWDQFRNYQERGDLFSEAVSTLEQM